MGDVVSVVINHDAPTFWNQVPMLDATLAIHSQRKIVWRNGLQVERTGTASAVVTLAALYNPRVLVEIARGGCQELPPFLDQLCNDIGIDRTLDPVIGHLTNFESVFKDSMKAPVQLLWLSKPQPKLTQGLTVARDLETLSQQKSLGHVETGVVDPRCSVFRSVISRQYRFSYSQ